MSSTATPAFDPQKAEAFAGRFVSALNDAMREHAPETSAGLAARSAPTVST